MVNYKKILNAIKDETLKEIANRAYVKYVNGTTIEAYSPVFKDITIHANSGTMGCKRGDEIEIKLSNHGVNYFELVQNITLNDEINKYVQNKFYRMPDNFNLDMFKTWRDAQLKNQKQL